jgi:ATP-dependent Clp protease ATP-binding subunit ClpC
VTVFERFTTAARKSVVLAQEWAVEQRRPGITTGDLLVGVAGADGGSGAAALADIEVPVDRVRRSALAVQPPGSDPPVERLPFTGGAKKALEFSLREALRLADRDIDSGHLLLGLLAIDDDDLDRVLAEAGIDVTQLREATERRLAARPKVEQAAAEANRLRRIELLLTDMLARLERIERRLDRS